MSPLPFAATSRLKTIGRSMKMTRPSVRGEVVHHGRGLDLQGRLTVNLAVGVDPVIGHMRLKGLPYPKKCSSPVVGQIFGCAVIESSSLPPKS